MGQLYATGPAAFFAGVSQNRGLRYVGHSRRRPRIRLRRFKEPITTDLSGRAPHDMLYGGQMATVSCELIRYNHDTISALQDLIGARAEFGGGATLGTDLPGAIGALGNEEEWHYPLVVTFPYAAKARFRRRANGVQPAGYRFHSVSLDDDDLEIGFGAKTISVTWTCIYGPMDTAQRTPTGQGRFDLYRLLALQEMQALTFL